MSHTRSIRLTEAAEADLAELWAYLAVEASEAIASRFLDGLIEGMQPLSDAPHLGPARDHLAPSLRVIFHASYAIYYQVLDDVIAIIRVLHGARDIAAIAESGGLE